jgi:hypothetical protein
VAEKVEIAFPPLAARQHRHQNASLQSHFGCRFSRVLSIQE